MLTITRRATVEHLGENRIRLTCVDCGHVWTKAQKFLNGKSWSSDATAWMVQVWQSRRGVTTKCPACLKRRTNR